MSPRPGTGLTTDPKKRAEIRRLNKEVHSEAERRELSDALVASGSNDPRMITLANMLLDPACRTTSPGVMLQKLQIRYADVAKVFSEHKRAEGLIRMARHYPDVMEDVAIDSKSREVTCTACGGFGKLIVKVEGVGPEDRPCAQCDGHGAVRIMGDAANRKLLMEAAGLIGQKGPLVDARKLQIGGDGESLEDTLRAITRPRQQALPAQTVSVEVVSDGTD